MKLFLLNMGEILIDEKYKPIALAGTWRSCGIGYVYGSSGKYRDQFLHIIIARLAGLDTSNLIDHIDMNPRNNQLSNLRPATKSENAMNRNAQSNNTTGLKGVYYDKRRQKYYTQIQTKEKRICSRNFDTAEEASEVREEAALKYHGEFAR